MSETNTACCATILPDGRWVECRAQAATLANNPLAALKVKANQRQMLVDALLAARMGEAQYDAAFRVTVESSASIAPEQGALLALSAILADRMARGLLRNHARHSVALGVSPNWLDGVITPLPLDWHQQCLQHLAESADLGVVDIYLPATQDAACAHWHQRIQAAHPLAVLRELDSLASLQGQPTPGSALRRARVWFPVLGNGQDQMLDLELVLRPLAGMGAGQGEIIEITGLPDLAKAMRDSVTALLRGLRQQDRHGLGEWRTLVRLPLAEFTGDSFELALAMADRLARGRDFCGSGRLIASGAMQRGADGVPSGQVLHVKGEKDKCAVILAELQAGGRVLLPLSWRECVPADFVQQVVAKGGSCAFVARVG